MEAEEEELLVKLKRENETLKACMTKFEREWNAALSTLGINVPSIANGKHDAPGDSAPNGITPQNDDASPASSSQPLHSLATLIAAASHLTPQ
jgi:hypothetical protein